MQVEVVDVGEDGRVVVRSPYGTFTAGWQGDSPAVGSQQAVELDVGGVALWDRDIDLAEEDVSGGPRLVDDGPCVRLAGRIIEFGADDVVVLDVGGTPVMVDVDGDPPLGVVDRHAVIRACDVTLYPYDL